MKRALATTLLLLLPACGGDASVDTAEVRGEQVYKTVCVTCHGPDPSRDGTVGPAIAGASAELIEAKVVRGEYPPGYTPSRPGQLMLALPHLKEYVPDLAAYLQSVQSTPSTASTAKSGA